MHVLSPGIGGLVIVPGVVASIPLFVLINLGAACYCNVLKKKRLQDPAEREKVRNKLIDEQLDFDQRVSLATSLNMNDAYEYELFNVQAKIDKLFQLYRLAWYSRQVNYNLYYTLGEIPCIPPTRTFSKAVREVSKPLLQALSGESVVTTQPSVTEAHPVLAREEQIVQSVKESLEEVDKALAGWTKPPVAQ